MGASDDDTDAASLHSGCPVATQAPGSSECIDDMHSKYIWMMCAPKAMESNGCSSGSSCAAQAEWQNALMRWRWCSRRLLALPQRILLPALLQQRRVVCCAECRRQQLRLHCGVCTIRHRLQRGGPGRSCSMPRHNSSGRKAHVADGRRLRATRLVLAQNRRDSVPGVWGAGLRVHM